MQEEKVQGVHDVYTYTIIIMPIIIIHAYSYGIPLDCHGSYDMVHYHLAYVITSSDMCIVCVRMSVHIIDTYIMCIHTFCVVDTVTSGHSLHS